MSPRGRRPGAGDTRADILAAARTEFGENGYDRTSLRGVARRAGVDPKMVHHWFDGKADLYRAVLDAHVDRTSMARAALDGPRDHVGHRLIADFLDAWDSPEGRQRFRLMYTSVVAPQQENQPLRECVNGALVLAALEALAADDGVTLTPVRAGELARRAALTAAVLVGVGMSRFVLGAPAMLTLTREELIDVYGPILQKLALGEG